MYECLKKLRVRKKVSTWDLVLVLGLKTRAAYYKKENGKVKFTLDDAKKIADYFHMSIEEVFFTHNSSK